MTPTKAKMILNRIAHCRTDNCPPDECGECDYGVTEDDCIEAIETAIEALEKQIPMKAGIPELGLNGEKVIPCDNCDNELVHRLWSFCPWCGQAIDWGENNDTD